MTVVINGDTGITSVDGSAAAPSITGADSDTGIVYGTNTLSLATGGTTAVIVDSSQNVGIGSSTTNRLSFTYSGVTGAATIGPNSTGGSTYLTLGTSNAGTYAERMRIDASGVITGTAGNLMLVAGTDVSASGTSVDYTSIPSWVRRITVMFSGLSTNGTSIVMVRLGVGGTPQTSGYSGSITSSTPATVALSAGFNLAQSTAATHAYNGTITMSLLSASTNTWAASGTIGLAAGGTYYMGGSVALSGVADMVRITTAGGTNTFDAGTLNILYE
jgi:hypothetical protein